MQCYFIGGFAVNPEPDPQSTQSAVRRDTLHARGLTTPPCNLPTCQNPIEPFLAYSGVTFEAVYTGLFDSAGY